MCPQPNRAKAYQQALKRNCLKPDIGRLLNEFNEKILQGEFLYEDNVESKIPYYEDMIQHLIECRSCRQHLNEWAKHLLSGELFWSGHFLTEQAKIERQKFRIKWERAEGKEWMRLMDKYLKMVTQEPFKTEYKKIKQFIKD